MQTFLPSVSFKLSAEILDYRRLGKQRVEALQIINILERRSPSSRWKHHPAIAMWLGYTDALKEYYETICNEWVSRGYKHTMIRFAHSNNYTEYPWWLGNKAFHDSHKSNLLRKDPKYYSQFNWTVPDNLPYIWPIRDLVI